jgi:16S rRNA (uracil1498-N3)-methyltransferase
MHYLLRVLRLQSGDRFIAMDGQGHSWVAELEKPESSQLQAKILETVAVKTELPVVITLALALPKGNGFDEVVRQATELGVASIAPVMSDRTLLKPSPQKLERWRRIAQEAAEQSERQIVPTILEPVPFAHYLQVEDKLSIKYLCVTRRFCPHILTCQLPTPDSRLPLTIAIGPEGGWTKPEVEQAIAAGFQPVSLGSRILRAVTAPIVALSLIAAFYESEQQKNEE